MKKFLLCFVLTFLVISCSTESDFNPSENSNSNGVALKSSSKIPENKANPFDAKGKEYYDVLTIYFQKNTRAKTLTETTDQIQFLSKNYVSSALSTQRLVTITLEQVSLIMNDPENQLMAIIDSCALSAAAKEDLISFIKVLLEQQGQEYSEVYDAIVMYEASVIESTTLEENEKETILTVSSVSRYALYADSEHKDRDWEILVANRKAQKSFNSYKTTIVSMIALFRKFV
ncbi:hypothetical protein [Flavobacterium granuli]|uniref:Ribonucleotide reductase alpha subunit n=1 Tax=Flavobacterium granuli TaxID=280093 RepID=A0ABU1S4M6_9FLAO|nr:hypothetical protein [Flavobacterium granuli]MDR6845580.1 ribonucleotide reductase alpha subunit [Flavobacterium granuli]